MTQAPALQGIRILHLEDDWDDATLVSETLAADNIEAGLMRVQSREDFVRALESWTPDMVLADYNLPAFDGLSALEIVRTRDPGLPFIFVSGTIGEDLAVDVLKLGATDFVLKERLSKLPNAVRRALAESGERKKLREAETALRESEARLQEIAATIQEAFWILTPEADRVLYVSSAFERIWGRPSASIVGKGLEAFLEAIHPDDRARVEHDFGCLPEAKHEMEIRILRPDGELRWVRSRSYLVRDAAGRVLRIIGASEDVTERRRMEEQFLQAQKMEVVGRLAGGVAHDFNNLLTVITGYGDLALARLSPEDPVRPMVNEIYEAGRRAANLTRQLLAFSRKQMSEPKILDLNALVTGMEKMLQRLMGEDLQLVTALGRDLWSVRADPGHLEQVIVNLVVNSRDAMPSGGKIVIETANVELDDVYVKLHSQARPGPHTRLSVNDTGVGMDAEILSHLFEPFFTTKEPGKGTGLGLSTVHGIVRQSGGHVEVYSELGQGTTFKVYLPRAAKGSETERKVRPQVAVPRGSGTLLLAEDSDTVRRLCEEILRSAGYDLLLARDGLEALQFVKEHPGTIHLLLTDTVMPGMGGAELAVHAARARPEIRVLFMSGYTDRGIEDQGLLEIGASFIQKPFTMDGLLRKVRDVLEGR